MESYSVKAVLSVSDQSFTKKMQGAVKSLDELDRGSQRATSSIMDIAEGVGVFKAVSVAAETLTASLGKAIDRFDTLNRYPRVMEQMGFSSEEANQSIQKLSDGIDGLPTSLDGIASSTQNIAVLTGDLNKATDTALALNNAFLASGASTEDAERGLNQYVQMLSKGQVDLESWRTLQETMGYALRVTGQELGIVTGNSNDLYSAIQSGQITFDQFNDALIECSTRSGGFAESAGAASAGIRTSITNMQTAVVRGMANIIQSTNDALENNGLPGLQGMIENATSGINTAFNVAAKGTTVLVNNLDVLIPTLGTAAAGFVTYKAAMDIRDKAVDFKKQMADAVDVLNSAADASKLAEKAAKAREKATKMAKEADMRSTLAQQAEEKALKARMKADELAADATKARKAADEAAAKVAKSSVVTSEMQAKAEQLKAEADKKAAAAAAASTQADKKATQAAAARDLAERTSAASINLNTAAEEANTVSEIAGAKASQVSNVAIATKTALLAVLSGQMTIAEAAQKALNAAMTANPIGTIITAITAAITVITALVKIVQKLNKKYETFSYRNKKAIEDTEELTKSLEESQEAFEDSCRETKNSAGAVGLLAETTAELAGKSNRSAADTALLKSNIEQLNDSVEGLNLSYDEQTGKLNMSEDAMLALVEAYKKQAEAEIYAERYKEILEQQLNIQDQLTESTALLEEAQDKMNTQAQYGNSVSTITVIQMEKQKKAIQELEDKKAELAAEEQEVTDKIAECQQEATDATAAATAAQKSSNESLRVDLANLSETQEDTLDRIVTAYQTMTDSLSSLNDKIETDDELTWSQVKANQEDTIAKTKEFADMYTQLIDAGVSESYLNAIGATGPEALPLLRGMMESGIDEVLNSQTQWQEAYDSINHTFVDSLQLSDEDKATVRSFIAGESGVLGTMQQALEAADFAAMMQPAAKDTVAGYKNQVQKEIPGLKSLGLQMTEPMKEGTESGLGIGSPSKVYAGYGRDTIQGYINGIEEKQGVLVSAMQKIMGSAGKGAAQSLGNSLDAMLSVSEGAFANISDAAEQGMREVQTTISVEIQKSNTQMRSGLEIMRTTVQSSFRYMETYTESGMAQISRAVSNGMIQAKTQVATESNNMVRALASLESRFYSSGYDASLGLARGINAGAPSAVSAARKLANRVANTINSALKIHSPSDVTWDSGEFVTEGLAGGMLDRVKIVENAADRIAAAAVPTGRISRLAEQASRYSADMSYSYSGETEMARTIVVVLDVDGREFARATAEDIGQELVRSGQIRRNIRGR